VTCPPLKTFGDQSVSEAFKLLVLGFHLIILRVKYNRLLDLLNVLFLQYVFSHAQRGNTEICFKSVSDQDSTHLANIAVKQLKFCQSCVLAYKTGNSFCTYFTEIQVAKLENLKTLVLLL